MSVHVPTAGPRPARQPADPGDGIISEVGASRRPASPGSPGPRRLSPRLRKWIVAAHVLVGVGWFGITTAKLVLEIVAATIGDPDVARAGYVYAAAFDRAVFPPVALANLITGIVVSVGTAWGLFRHWWIVVKLALTIGVIVTGVTFVGAWTEAATATAADAEATSLWLIGAALTHLLMLGAATVISILKPWGQIRPDHQDAVRRAAPSRTTRSASRDVRSVARSSHPFGGRRPTFPLSGDASQRSERRIMTAASASSGHSQGRT